MCVWTWALQHRSWIVLLHQQTIPHSPFFYSVHSQTRKSRSYYIWFMRNVIKGNLIFRKVRHERLKGKSPCWDLRYFPTMNIIILFLCLSFVVVFFLFRGEKGGKFHYNVNAIKMFENAWRRIIYGRGEKMVLTRVKNRFICRHDWNFAEKSLRKLAEKDKEERVILIWALCLL